MGFGGGKLFRFLRSGSRRSRTSANTASYSSSDKFWQLEPPPLPSSDELSSNFDDFSETASASPSSVKGPTLRLFVDPALERLFLLEDCLISCLSRYITDLMKLLRPNFGSIFPSTNQSHICVGCELSKLFTDWHSARFWSFFGFWALLFFPTPPFFSDLSINLAMFLRALFLRYKALFSS